MEKPKQIRGADLITKILDATLRELAKVGPDRLSIDAIASHAKVNRTTIYRRWATPQALVQAAIERVADIRLFAADTGTLHSDLAAFARELHELFLLPEIQWLLRMHFGGAISEPFGQMLRKIEAEKHMLGLKMIERAVDRGELPPDTDVGLLYKVIIGTVQNLVLFSGPPCAPETIDRAMSLILHGAVRAEPPAKPRPKTRASKADD